MTDISLTVNGKTFTFAEGEVGAVRSSISSGIENQTVSASGPMGSYIYDYEGCSKLVTIRGRLFETTSTRVTGYSVNTIVEQKQWLESLANGTQGNITLTSNYESTSVLYAASATAPYQGSFSNTTGKVKSLSFNETLGEVNKLDFELVLQIGS